jgi:ribose transport system substrate-binding protein
MLRGRFLVPALACLLLCGCGTSKPAGKYRIAVIPKGLTHEHWQSVERGAQRAADDLKTQGLGVEVLWDGPTKESEISDQIGIVERNVNRGVSGLVLAPQHSGQMVRPVEEAQRNKVPTVVIDSALDREDLVVKYVATDNYKGGQLAAKHLLELLEKDGKKSPRLVLLRYQVGSESTEQREQGFLDVVTKVPGVKVVSDDQYAGATVETATQAAGPLLTRLTKDGFDGIFAVNESAATGLLNSMRSLGMNKKVRFVAFDSSEPLRQAIREGDVDGTIVQDPYRMGYLGVWVLVQHLEGYEVSPDGKKALGTGETVVTKDNLDSPEVQGLFNPEVQKTRKIETPTLPRR